MKKIYVKDIYLNSLESITNECFMLISIETLQDRNGNNYIKLVIGDKTGKIDAKIWNDKFNNISIESLKTGTIISVTGKIETFKNIKQVNISSIENINTYDITEYIQSSIYPITTLTKILTDKINSIKDAKIKDVIMRTLNHEKIKGKFEYWPAASNVHHNFRSGLLQHIVEMLEMLDGIIKYYPNVNLDIIIAGIILHDIGKLEELNSDIQTEYTIKGKVIGHVVLGALIFYDVAKDILDEETFTHILHIIISHHGSLEFGSPVVPLTLEAYIVSKLDDISSKLRMVDKFITLTPPNAYFSETCKWLNNTQLWNGKLESKTTIHNKEHNKISQSLSLHSIDANNSEPIIKQNNTDSIYTDTENGVTKSFNPSLFDTD
ncbi:MAG: HD domain-containing protein [Candidatus Dojkabacteria bacterium]|nr:HD domain-containing protein [Candidatus Dojkabacteria bacterium]